MEAEVPFHHDSLYVLVPYESPNPYCFFMEKGKREKLSLFKDL